MHMVEGKAQTYRVGSQENLEETSDFQKTREVKSIETLFPHLNSSLQFSSLTFSP